MDILAIGGNINALAIGAAAIGPGVGIGLVFSAYIQATARQPESSRMTQPFMWLGFALIEALALFGIAFAFVFSS
jgi:F-type H+-transporting ATPase subunit c